MEAREAIFAKIEELFGTISGVNEIERMPSGDPNTFPALHIFDETQDTDEGETDATEYVLNVGIDGYVESAGGSAAHTQINALYGDVIRALFTEPPLDGLVTEIDEGSMKVIVAPLASERRLAFSLDLRIHFQTVRGDPAQP